MRDVAKPATWYEAPKREVHEAVFQQVNYVKRQQSAQREAAVVHLETYAAGNVAGLGTGEATSRYYYVTDDDAGTPEVRFNVTAALVDTAASLISQAPTVPQYQTTDGDFALAMRAEKASEVLQSQISREVQEIIKRAALDSMKVGTGFVFECFDPITGMPGVQREHMLSVLVEHADGLYMKPRSMHRTCIYPKETLKAQYPHLATQIEACAGVTRDVTNDVYLAGLGKSMAFSDMVELVESWHLRPGPKGTGRHTICIATATLLDEKYQRDDFPCAVFRYRERDFGFFGSGLVESAMPAQHRIDTLIRRIARAQDLASNIVILNPNGEDAVKPEQITNELGLVLNYQPNFGPPTLVKWEGTLGDLMAQVDVEVQRLFMAEGISESQANGMGAGKGLDSGVAVRAADDVQSRRLVPYVRRLEMSCMNVAKLFEAMNDVMAAKDKSYQVSAEGAGARKRFLKTSQWIKIRPPKGDARLAMQSMSALPTTPQGRFAAVMEWIQAGFTSRSWAMRLLEAPDLDAYASTELAHLDLARWQIMQILEGDMPHPDPRQDLDLAIDLSVKSKFQAQIMGADDEVLARFEDFIVYCEELVAMAAAKAAPPAPPPGMPPGLPPPGAGGLPPGQDLMTQVAAPGLGQPVM